MATFANNRQTVATQLVIAALGTLVIASTYGMARFGVGLFAPAMVDTRPDLDRVVGWASGAQFLAYAIAALAAARIADTQPRAALLLAGATSTTGCVGIAAADTAGWFITAVFVAGAGAGFASPALVRVLDATVARRSRATVQSLVNTGTAIGVAATGCLALALTPLPAWLLMAAVCATSAAGVLLVTARAGGSLAVRTSPASTPCEGFGSHLGRPAAAALVAGMGSALIWTYGPLLATRSGPVDADAVGTLWLALGIGGLAGPLTGWLADRHGISASWRGHAAILALANLSLGIGLAAALPWAMYAAMALFGCGYMCLSGVLILWARHLRPDAAAAATSYLFVSLAVGQAVGAVGFQLWLDIASPVPTCFAGGLLCAAAATGIGRALPTGQVQPRSH